MEQAKIPTTASVAGYDNDSSWNSNNVNDRIVSQGSIDMANMSGLTRRLSQKSQKIMDEMRQQAEIAFATETDVLSNIPPHYIRGTLPLMRKITEESREYSISIRSNSVRSHLSSQNNMLSTSAFYDSARLDRRIADFDLFLERENSVAACYHERLLEIRGVFDDFRARRVRRDAPGSMNLRDLDLEVQVACWASSNIKLFTRLLLDGDTADKSKRDLRDHLRYSEQATNSWPFQNHHEVLERLKEMASSAQEELESGSWESSVVFQRRKSVTLRKDVEATMHYFRQLLLLRYQHMTYESMDTYRPQVRFTRLKPLGMYVRWKAVQDYDVALALAEYAGVHPVELDHVFQDRLRSLLDHIEVDSGYVRDRLMDLDNIWRWVYAYNRLANNAQWGELASQFYDDREQFDAIYPGGCTYVCPEKDITQPNDKAKVYIGMAMLRGHFFSRIDSPDSYSLSRSAKHMDRRIRRAQEEFRLKREQEEQERLKKLKPRTLARLKDWAKRARGSISFNFSAEVKAKLVLDGGERRN
ncbi:MAG: hypothetical protein Q9201_002362 [Fulgogasparrea decipioides]